jgi:hypothetical protein
LTVLAALKPAYDGVIAEKENVFFEVYHNPQKKGEFKFIENWNASVKWFMTVSDKPTRREKERCIIQWIDLLLTRYDDV